MSISIPRKCLFECRGLEVTVETDEFAVTGNLVDFDEYMNLNIDDAEIKKRGGEVYCVEQIFVKGNSIILIVMPPMVQYSPFLKK